MASVMMLCGCVGIEYVGDKFPATEDVRVYFSPNDMPPGLRKIGEATVTIKMLWLLPVPGMEGLFDFLLTADSLNDKLRERGKEIGAEAVLITGNQRVVTATHTTRSESASFNSGGYSGGASTTRYNSTSKIVGASYYKNAR